MAAVDSTSAIVGDMTGTIENASTASNNTGTSVLRGAPLMAPYARFKVKRLEQQRFDGGGDESPLDGR